MAKQSLTLKTKLCSFKSNCKNIRTRIEILCTIHEYSIDYKKTVKLCLIQVILVLKIILEVFFFKNNLFRMAVPTIQQQYERLLSTHTCQLSYQNCSVTLHNSLRKITISCLILSELFGSFST